jgi:hypothetical protein
MSLGPGPAILIREPRRSYIDEHGAFDIRPEPAAAIVIAIGLLARCPPIPINPVYRALGWSSADYIQIHCGALCAD